VPAVPPDSVAARRVVREFPAIEVQGALLHDLRSSQTVHVIAPAALRDYPADRLAELVALKPGVVALGDELHVRGGRAGETLVSLDGVSLNEPLRHRPMEVPLLAIRSAELVSGTPETRHAGSIAGVLDLRTVDPGEHPSGEARWQTDGGLDTRFDRVSARVSVPVAPLGLGVVLAGDALLDDTSFPALRSAGRQEIAGFSFGWRAENRMLGYAKLASLRSPGRFSAQVLGGRLVHRPYDPMWSLDGWSGFNAFGLPVFSPDSVPGFDRYRAADHQSMTDERRVATILTASGSRGGHRGSLTLGWLHTRTATTVGGGWTIPEAPENAAFAHESTGDPFHVIRGDDPLYRVSGSDMVTLRADAELATRTVAPLRVGLGGTWERVEMDELDATLLTTQLDAWRRYRATAPGGFAYGQGRWQSGGLVLNAGLRAEVYSAGPEADDQTLPGSPAPRWSLLPRLGLAYPLSSRDVFSMAYARVDEAPPRDLLYDQRTEITNRQPLGNPALRPATLISYEAALRRLLAPAWAAQAAFFYRDIAHQAGARDYQTPGGPVDLRYTDEDQASAAGLELSVLHAPTGTRRIEAHYTFMHAWGYESRPEGDPYGPVREPGTAPFAERPLSWDRRHSVLVTGLWQWGGRVTLAGSYRVGSPLPWTPKTRRQPLADLTQVNSRRFGWSQIVHAAVTVAPPYALGLTFGLEVRNLLNDRSERVATEDGFPNPVINTAYDDYGAYRTETGLAGGAFWTTNTGWVPVHDPRLLVTPRTVRASIGRRW
jgi:outer membrane receptor protein involved in Fe transport